MLAISEILKEYPESLRGFKNFIIREYLQYKILQILFDSRYAGKFSFLGGACLRIVHGNRRFSEDLDFDNFELKAADFKEVSKIIEKGFIAEGYEVEMKTVMKRAYHCHIRFPRILYDKGISGHYDEKILIQLDTEPQHFDFVPEKVILNKFDVFTQINCTPADILLAQKFYAILNRKRNKGRDFFDAVFLLSKVKSPNYDYLQLKAGIKNGKELKKQILDHCKQIDMNEMARDVQPFLFDSGEASRVRLFPEYIEQVKL